MSDLHRFRSDVEAYLEKHGMSAARFGRLAVGDGSFVFQLREGREPRSALRERVNDFMAREAEQAAA